MPQRMSFLRYMGGKQRLVPALLPLIPEHFAYVEVFGGAGSLLLNKPRSNLEVYNDLDGELVNLFEVVRGDVDTFIKRAEFLVYSRELYERWESDFKNDQVPSDRVERAVRFWYLIRSSFGAHPYKGWGFRKKQRSMAETLPRCLANLHAIHERLRTVEIDHLDFRKCIHHRDAPNTFMFLDPPYLATQKYRVGAFTLDDHRALAETLHNVKSQWLLTIGDQPEIRMLYRGFPRETIELSVAVEKVTGGKRKSFANLVIRNYELPKTPLYVPVAGQPELLDMFGSPDVLR